MLSTLAFFPWCYVDAPVTIGPLRLLPYRKAARGLRALPGDQPHISQADINGIFGAYADRPNVPIRKAAIVEFDDWYAGMEPTPIHVTEFFRIRNLVAFAALAQRVLFRDHFGYCNYDTYALVAQRYRPGETATFAFTTRRRDGGTSQLWGSDEFAFHRPLHVTGSALVSLDVRLLTALLNSVFPEAYEALVEFNSANTDSSAVPEHVELVMCKSAFEWLLGVNSDKKAFLTAVETRLADCLARRE